MAKAESLMPDALSMPATKPQAATPARSPAAPPPARAEKPENVPFQIRIPKGEAKAIRVLAAQREQSISDFVLMCVQDWQKRNGSAA